MRKKYRSIFIFCYALLIIVSLFLPFFSFEGYSIVSNTTSHLAAQGSPFAWIMNTMFVFLGVMAIIAIFDGQVLYHRVIGSIFGMSLVMTAFFPHAPLVDNLPVNLFIDQAHSIFASMTGFSFTVLSIGHIIISKKNQRIGAFILAFVSLFVSLGMITFPSLMGLLQRLMLYSAFWWIFFYMDYEN